MLQQLHVPLLGDSQVAGLCSDCAVLQPNLPQAEGAGNLKAKANMQEWTNEEKAIVNYLVLSWYMNLVSGLQHPWQVITDLELVCLPLSKRVCRLTVKKK